MKWRVTDQPSAAHPRFSVHAAVSDIPHDLVSAPTVPRFLSRDAEETLIANIHRLASSRGRTSIDLSSDWRSDVRWARNRVSVSGDWRDREILIRREGNSPGAAGGSAVTNQFDTLSLTSAIRWAERMWRTFPGRSEVEDPIRRATDLPVYPKTHIWSETTYTMPSDQLSEIANQLLRGAEAAGMQSAGYLSISAQGTTCVTDDGQLLYAPQTFAEYSVTVRDPEGTGSGWAGASSYDWARFDAQKFADIALHKCLTSRHPVAIEPGHYTTILEPQATFELLSLLFRAPFPYLDLLSEETDEELPFHDGTRAYTVSPWGKPEVIGGTKIGQRVLDERITVSYDPVDPDLGICPFTFSGEPYVPLTWIENGILTTLNYDRDFGLNRLHEPLGKPDSRVFRMSGGTTTIDEMITTTKRGLLVTRFWNTNIVDAPSIMSTGMTRDGLWLIENGKISHPVKNLRFRESPLFAFNQVEQLGVPVPVFSPKLPAIVPPVKVRDFSFTSLVDAV